MLSIHSLQGVFVYRKDDMVYFIYSNWLSGLDLWSFFIPIPWYAFINLPVEALRKLRKFYENLFKYNYLKNIQDLSFMYFLVYIILFVSIKEFLVKIQYYLL